MKIEFEIMEKKIYILPWVEITLFNTAELMTVSDPSDVPTEPTTGGAGAPAQRTAVF